MRKNRATGHSSGLPHTERITKFIEVKLSVNVCDQLEFLLTRCTAWRPPGHQTVVPVATLSASRFAMHPLSKHCTLLIVESQGMNSSSQVHAPPGRC